MNNELHDIQAILDSKLPYREKKEALFALCIDSASKLDSEKLTIAANALRKFGEVHEDEKTITWSTLYRGFVFYYQKEFERALEVFQSVLPIFEKLDDKAGIARTTLNIGRVYLNDVKDYSTAKIYLDRALLLEIDLNNSTGISRAFGNVINLYQHMGLFKELLTISDQLLPILEQSGDLRSVAKLLNDSSLIAMTHLSDTQTAMEYAERALKIYKELGDKHGENQALDHLGAAHWYLGEIGRSIEYYAQCIRVAEEAGDVISLANRLTNAAYPYMVLEDYEKVLELNRRALDIFEKNDSGIDSGWAEMGIGQALLGIGDAEQALEHNLRAVLLTKQNDDFHGEGYAHFRCGEALVTLERYDEAYKAFNKSHECRMHSNAKLEIADVQCERGKLLVRFGLIEEAIAALNESLAISESISAKVICKSTLLFAMKFILGILPKKLQVLNIYTIKKSRKKNKQQRAVCSIKRFPLSLQSD